MALIKFDFLEDGCKAFEFDRPIDFKLLCAHEIDAIPQNNDKTYLFILTYDMSQYPFWIIGSKWECVEVIDFAIREMYCLEYGDVCEIQVSQFKSMQNALSSEFFNRKK